MKIWVDSTLAFKNEVYNLIPLIVINGTVEIEDQNSDFLYNQILSSENISQYTTSFYPVAKLEEEINSEEETLIMTIPKKLSGQYAAYKPLEKKYPKLKIVEGTSFYSHYDETLSLLVSKTEINELVTSIQELNKKVFYQGIISNFSHINKKGRISTTAHIVISLLRLKAHLIFENGEWKRHNLSKNIKRLIKDAVGKIKDTNNVTLYCANEDNEMVKILKDTILETHANAKVKTKRFTVAMLIHSGKDFVVIG